LLCLLLGAAPSLYAAAHIGKKTKPEGEATVEDWKGPAKDFRPAVCEVRR
jgi:hypothetical protein